MAGNFLKKSRHGTVYYFRRRVPIGLQHVIGRTTLVHSLQTSDRRLAIIRSRALAAQSDVLFQRIMAKKSGNSGGHATDYSLRIELNEIGLPTAISVEAQPEEQEAVNSAIKTALETSSARTNRHAPPKAQKPFKEAVSEFYAKKQSEGSSLKTFRARFNLAENFFGSDTDILSIEQGRFTEFCDHVLKVKANRSESTRNFYMANVAQLINWHIERTFGKNTPMVSPRSILIKKTSPEALERDGFSIEQIRLLFENAKQYQERSPCKLWASVVPVFTGMRLEELGQINLATDLIHDETEDIWYLKLNEGSDKDGIVRKSIKKVSNWRNIPLHSTLIQHGFVDFLQAQKKAGYSRPFESQWKPLDTVDNVTGKPFLKWTHMTSRWGSTEFKKLKETESFEEKQGYFHSQRHSCKTILSEAGVSEEISEAIAGRRYGSSDAERYGKLKFNHVRLYKEGIAIGLDAVADILDDVLKV